MSFIERFHQSGDPLINDYPLMGNPFSIPAILTVYLIFVLKVGPYLMKHRAPFQIDGLVRIYNLVQILMNSYMIIAGRSIVARLDIFCTPVTTPDDPLAQLTARLVYCYIINKILDLLDTVFFVLRKKNNQITVLHVYHHVLMAGGVWLGSKYVLGGHGCLLGAPNVVTHIFMYFYYFLTSWKPEYKKKIWWKKYLTQLQIVHQAFIVMTFTLVLFNPHCTFPKLIACLCILNGIVILTMFGRFYNKHYLQKKEM